jgi:hypothetical protein
MSGKNISIVTLILAVIVLNISCKKEDMPYKPGPSPFSVSVEGNKMNVSAVGDTLLLNIKAGSNGWWIVVPDDKKSWCEPLNKKMYGSGDFILSLIFKRNNTGSARSVTIDVNSSYQQPKVTFAFNQAG